MDADSIVNDFRRYFSHTLGRDKMCLAAYHVYTSLSLSLRDRLVERWKNTQYAYEEQDCKRTYYLSLEFLMGRALGNAMLNLEVDKPTEEALRKLGLVLEEIADQEHDAGLGNGGLGRLAACFLDSCATLQLPVMGYGIRYEYGMFRQNIENGYQVEEPDHWLRDGNPWEIERPEYTLRVKFGGRTEFYHDADGSLRARWVDTQDVLAVPYDMPIPGYRNGTVNTLRLWKAAATDEFDLDEFNAGSYTEAVAAKNDAENITMVLYPNDASENGKELRLRQQYFLASASLQDVLRNWVQRSRQRFQPVRRQELLPAQRHPPHLRGAGADAPADGRARPGLGRRPGTSPAAPWPTPTTPCCRKRWRDGRCSMFGRLLPRLLEIIYEINARFLRRSGAALAGRHRPPAAHVDHRGRRRAAGAHGLSGDRRQLLGQRRGRAALAAAAAGICSAISTNCGRTSSTTRPTASRRAAGWPAATPA